MLDLGKLDETLLEISKNPKRWDELQSCVFERGQLLRALGDLISLKHCPPLTQDQITQLQKTHALIVETLSKFHRLFQRGLEATNKYNLVK